MNRNLEKMCETMLSLDEQNKANNYGLAMMCPLEHEINLTELRFFKYFNKPDKVEKTTSKNFPWRYIRYIDYKGIRIKYTCYAKVLR